MATGRPTEYRPEFIERAKELCANGATNYDLADEFGVSVQTIRSWRAKYPDFLTAIKVNKDLADELVERSLYERATGYSHNSVKIFLGKDGKIVEAPFTEHVPPDATAMIFWLKNRKPAEWRDTTAGDSADNPLHLKFEDVRDELKAKLARREDQGSAGS
jgi:hypothetical protein